MRYRFFAAKHIRVFALKGEEKKKAGEWPEQSTHTDFDVANIFR